MVSPRPESRSQHFLWNRQLVDRLVRASSLSPTDLVLEIGAGRGILTEALLRAAGRVIAVELDERLCRRLGQRLGRQPNLVLVQGDFLSLPLPREPYKVFSNIPFSRTAAILRKLLHSGSPPSDCALIIQREAALKFCPADHHNSLAALLYYPWWDIRVTHRFQRRDFVPPPSVDSCLLRLTRRENPLLDPRHAALYQDYAAYHVGRDPRLGDLSPSAFLARFASFLRRSSSRRRRAVRGAFSRLQAQQAHLRQIHRTRTDPDWRRFAG